MCPRPHVLEKFSTFIQFESDRFDRWIGDSRLHRNMQKCLENSNEQLESLWVGYWHEIWKRQSDQLADQGKRIQFLIIMR
jgi:hypothetical protein